MSRCLALLFAVCALLWGGAARAGGPEGPWGPGGPDGVPVTLYWHMADDADVYLNGRPLRRYEPSFRTRADEAPREAFAAQAVLREGDVFTVGGRRGGSYGFMLIAVDAYGRTVFCTNREDWKGYVPADDRGWADPALALRVPGYLVTVQQDPWPPQKELNARFGNPALSIWPAPASRFCFLRGVVTLRGGRMAMAPPPEPPPPVLGGPGLPVTLYWHCADDADVYLNGRPVRRFEPPFETRGDEAPHPAFTAQARLRNGDVFTVGGRRGGSFGFMLIAVDGSGRPVFWTSRETWKVYFPEDPRDWPSPAVARRSPKRGVAVQYDPWPPQKELNGGFGNPAQSIWSNPGDRTAYLFGVVNLGGGAP